MKAVGYAINVVVALISTIATSACAVPSVDLLRQYDTFTVALWIAPVLLGVFVFVVISRNWQLAAAKGMMIVSWFLAANFAVGLYEFYFVGKADAAAVGDEQMSLQFSTIMFFLGAAIMAMASVMMFMFGKDEFGIGIGNRVEKFKIPKL